MIVIQKLTLETETAKIYGPRPSVNFLKIDGASAGVNKSWHRRRQVVPAHITANNSFKNVDSVLARWPSLKSMTTAIATSTTFK